jgi:hypothetical protein
MLYHDHGADPATAHPMLQEAIAEYWTQEIGSAWLSGPHENMFPEGVHAGFVNLIENDTGCEQYKQAVLGNNCVMAYILQVHAAGTQQHGRVDVHSWKAILLVCDTDEISEDTCGYVVTGGWHDYIWTHAPYKQYFCENAGGNPDPINDSPNEQSKFQTPYVALGVEQLSRGQSRIFWSALGPSNSTFSEIMTQRGYIPNRGVQLAWSETDAWDYAVGFSALCADPAHDVRRCEDDVNDAMCINNGNEFQTFTIRSGPADWPSERPFIGFTDRWGNVQPAGACEAEGVDCVPLVISENVPQGDFLLNRNVDPLAAPLLNYDDGTLLRRPPFTLED